MGSSPISLVASSAGAELENWMKPSGRLLHRRQGVRRSERDLLSILIAEGRLSREWLVKCGDDRSVDSDLPEASELPLDPGRLMIRAQ
jgi:hypothetical protein